MSGGERALLLLVGVVVPHRRLRLVVGLLLAELLLLAVGLLARRVVRLLVLLVG